MDGSLFRLNRPKQTGLICFSWAAEQLTLVHVDSTPQGKPTLKLAMQQTQVSLAALPHVLLTVIQTHQLKNMPCEWVLLPNQFQLLLHHDLDVSNAELGAAARWQIKDMIHFPVTEAAVDAFRIPPYGAGKKNKKMYVVVAQNHLLQAVNKIIHDVGLQLNAITIIQLALQSMVNKVSAQTNCVGLLAPSEQGCEILISRAGDLYLSRFLDVALDEVGCADKLVIEIQRSYDFCESQLGFEAPRDLFCTPLTTKHHALPTCLQEQLASSVTLLKLEDFIDTHSPDLSLKESDMFPLVGEALQWMEQRHESTD